MELSERNSSDDLLSQTMISNATKSMTGKKTIEWKEHKEFLANGIRDFFLQEYHMDTNVTFRGECLRVHRLILAVFLPTFKRSLDVASKSKSNGGVNDNDISDVSFGNLRELNLDCVADRTEDVRALIEFVYTGSMTVSEDRLDHLNRLADDLSFEGLAKALGDSESQYNEVDRETNKSRKSTNVKMENDSFDDYDDDSVDDDEEEEVDDDEEDDDDEDDDDDDDDFLDECSEYCPTSDGEDESDDGKVVRRPTRHETAGRKDRAALDRYCEQIFKTLQQASSSSKDRKPSTSTGARSTSITRNNTNIKGKQSQPPPRKIVASSFKETNEQLVDDSVFNGTVCGNCKKKFVTSRSLRRHLKNCGPPLQYACRHCDHFAETRNILRRHMYSAHRREMAAERRSRVNHIKCPEPNCTFACDDQLKLKLHNRRMHCTDKKYKCPECEYSAIRQSELTNHVTMCHLKQRNFMCDHCGSMYASRSGLYSHVRATHEGYKHYKCEFCGKEFNTSQCYDVHVKSKHNAGGELEMHMCHICGKSYNRRWNLQLHTRRVHKISLESRVKVYPPRRKDPEGSGASTDTGQDLNRGLSATNETSMPGTVVEAASHNDPLSTISQRDYQNFDSMTSDVMSTAMVSSHVRPQVDELLEAIRSTSIPDANSGWVSIDPSPSLLHHNNQFMN